MIEQYAHKVWTVSLVLTQEAARAGTHGKGYAVIAHEATTFADKLYEYAGKVKFDCADETIFKGIADFAFMMKFLAVNAALEIMHMVPISMDFNIPKSMSVFAEQLRRIAIELTKLSDKVAEQKPFVIPELASPSETSDTSFFFSFSIGSYPLIESTKNIKEICFRKKADIDGKTFSHRDLLIPVINCYKRLDLSYADVNTDGQTIMLINLEGASYGKEEGLYAVPIDDMDVNAIFYSHPGRATLPQKGHAFIDYSRECWDIVGGDQVIFVDWKKIME